MIRINQINYIKNIGGRPNLEDNIYPPPGEASVTDKLFLVCDGVGGESMGEEASRIACEEFSAYFKQFPFPDGPQQKEFIDNAQRHVLGRMAQYAVENPGAKKMSTTLTLVNIMQDNVFAAWCGDSRIYHIRNGEVIWRSTDHSLVANLVKHGEITEEEARKHPRRNVITRSLSASGNVSEIETLVIKDICDGDYIMLCTDGLLEQIDETRLKGILLSPDNDKTELFMTYCKGKTSDNFSLYLLKLGSDRISKPGPNTRSVIAVIIATLVIILSIGLVSGTLQKWFAHKHVKGKDVSKIDSAKHNSEPSSAPGDMPAPHSKDSPGKRPGSGAPANDNPNNVADTTATTNGGGKNGENKSLDNNMHPKSSPNKPAPENKHQEKTKKKDTVQDSEQ